MRLRRVVTTGVVLGLVACAPSATAASKSAKKPAPKKLCNLLKDVPGDAAWHLVPLVESPVADILSGDIASGPREVVGVLRLGSTTFSPDDNAVRLGLQWTLAATLQNQDFVFHAKKGMNNGPLLGSVSLGEERLSSTPPKVVGNSLVWTIPRSAVKALAKPRQVFSEIRGESQIFSTTADMAPAPGEAMLAYPDRAPSCVPAK